MFGGARELRDGSGRGMWGVGHLNTDVKRGVGDGDGEGKGEGRRTG